MARSRRRNGRCEFPTLLLAQRADLQLSGVAEVLHRRLIGSQTIGRDGRTKPVSPEPYRLVANVDAPLEQQVLHVQQRQRVLDVQHHHEPDHLGRDVEIAKRIGALGHSGDARQADYRWAKFGLTEPLWLTVRHRGQRNLKTTVVAAGGANAFVAEGHWTNDHDVRSTFPPATLLIVEDEALVALVLCDALTDAGYHVLDLTARHAEAMSIAKASRPDLALVNIDLANGDDGVALAEQLKALGIPVVFISGQTSRARSAATVAIASMPKPYDAEDMVLAVNYLLARLEGSTIIRPPKGLEVFEVDAALSIHG